MCILAYFFDKILPICITISATALLFIIDKLIGYNLKKKESRRTWYVDMIIKPNIEVIHGFFEKTSVLIDELNLYLSSSGSLTINLHLEKKSEFINSFRQNKQLISKELSLLLRDKYRSKYNEIGILLNNIESDFAFRIDKMSMTQDYHVYINARKREFFNLLYEFIE